MAERIQRHQFSPSSSDQTIIGFQSASSRAINVGYIDGDRDEFVPGRLNLGGQRMMDTLAAMTQTFQLPEVQEILERYDEDHISTVTVMREAAAYQLPQALHGAGRRHYGDAFVGATHQKGNGPITTAYEYENLEGLVEKDGLWIIGDSICMGRNLAATLESLLSKYTPKEILFVSPLASRKGINTLGAICANKGIPTTFVVWGALYGVGDNDYDMPWGHPDTEPIDPRDQETFVEIYGPGMCVGGDFGNAYFSRQRARDLYQAQLDEQLERYGITPHIPSAATIKRRYLPDEILTR